MSPRMALELKQLFKVLPIALDVHDVEVQPYATTRELSTVNCQGVQALRDSPRSALQGEIASMIIKDVPHINNIYPTTTEAHL